MIQKSNASAIGASAKQSMETQYDLLSRKGWKTDKPSWQHSQKIPTATTISENLFLSSEVNMNFKIFEGYLSSSSSLCGASISCFLSGKGTPHDGGFDEWVLAQQVNEIMNPQIHSFWERKIHIAESNGLCRLLKDGLDCWIHMHVCCSINAFF